MSNPQLGQDGQNPISAAISSDAKVELAAIRYQRVTFSRKLYRPSEPSTPAESVLVAATHLCDRPLAASLT